MTLCRVGLEHEIQIYHPNVAVTEFETEGFTPYKIVRLFFVRLYLRINHVANRLIRISDISATQSHVQLICRTVIN